MNTREFEHPELYTQIESISGHYEYVRESTVEIGGRTLLYLKGYSVTDSSCCGVGGCIFYSIPGYVVKLNHAGTDRGTRISLVEPVTDENDREEIRKYFADSGTRPQILFVD